MRTGGPQRDMQMQTGLPHRHRVPTYQRQEQFLRPKCVLILILLRFLRQSLSCRHYFYHLWLSNIVHPSICPDRTCIIIIRLRLILVFCVCYSADDSDGKAGGSSLLGVVVGLLVFSALICFGLRLSTASRPRHFPTTNLYPNKLLCSRQTSRSLPIDF